MGKIIAITNQKGGVGKTTTAVNLSVAIARLNKKVLLIDLDSQANASTSLDVPITNIKSKIYQLITKKIGIKQAIEKKVEKNLEVIAGSKELAAIDANLGDIENYQYQLKSQIAKIKHHYDYIFFDCPPSLSIINNMALIAADTVLIPIQTEHFAMEGISQLFSTIRLVQRLYNKHLGIEGILVTMFDQRTRLSNEIKDLIQECFSSKAFTSYIPRNVRLAEAPSYNKSIFDYDQNSSGAKSYWKLAKEIVRNNEKKS